MGHVQELVGMCTSITEADVVHILKLFKQPCTSFIHAIIHDLFEFFFFFAFFILNSYVTLCLLVS